MTRRILLDENLPVRLRHWMPGIQATTVEFMGWKGMRNDCLSEIESGRKLGSITAFRKLAGTLDLSVDDLVP